MSVKKRIIEGSATSWLRVLLTLLTQILLVPFYLSNWTPEVYGVWLGITALQTMIQTLDNGHHNFLGFEFFKFYDEDKQRFSKHLFSGLLISVALSVVQVCLIYGLIQTGLLSILFKGIDVDLIDQAGMVLIIQGIVWCVSGSVGGLLVRALYPFGYLPRMGWWGLVATTITSIAPVVAVRLGATLLDAGIVLACSTILYNIPMLWDIKQKLVAVDIPVTRPSLKLGLSNFFKSLILSAKTLMELLRQQGVRLVLVPMVGSKALVDFSTMRTGANTMLQGLGTITNPIMPELIKFLKAKDERRVELTFGLVWLVIMIVLAPGTLILQAFVEPVFTAWTRGKVSFDPQVFWTLSLGVLVYGYAQPAMSVVLGNNLLRPQFLITVISSILLIAFLLVLVPWFGIKGASVSLLLVELQVSAGYTYYAKVWMRNNNVAWPSGSSRKAAFSILITALALCAMSFFPEIKIVILLGAIAMLFLIVFQYLNAMPIEILKSLKLKSFQYLSLFKGR